MNRPSLNEISALLDDSDDDDHRLADFLRKKQGPSSAQRVFGKYEPKRYSDFKIRLKKLPNIKKVVETEQRFPVEAETNKDDTEKQEEAGQQGNPMNQLQKSIFGAVGLAQIDAPPLLVNPEQFEVGDNTRKSPLTVSNSPPQATTRSLSQRLSIRKSGGVPSEDCLRRLSTISAHGRRMLLDEFHSLTLETDFMPNHCSTPMTQKPPSAPTSPKTPIKQTTAGDKGQTPINCSVSPCSFNETLRGSSDTEQLLIVLQKRDEALRDILEKDIDTANQNLEEQAKLDPVLKTPSPKRNISTSNSSELRRTYTIEKSTQPGEVILTPSKINKSNVSFTVANRQQMQELQPQDANNHQYSPPICPIEEAVYALHCGSGFVTPEKTTSTAHNKTPLKASPKVYQILRMMVKSPQQMTTISSMSTSKPKFLPRTPLGKSISIPEIPNTPVGAVVAEQPEEHNTLGNDIKLEKQHVSQLPGTPVRSPTIYELTQSFQGTKPPMVVVPIYQTFNQLPQTESNFKVGTENQLNETNGSGFEQAAPSTENIKKSEDKGVNTTNNLINKTFNRSSNKTFNKSTSAKQFIDDNLRFEDIVIDDEDDAPQAPTLKIQNSRHKTDLSCTNAPLNLAPSPGLCDARRMRNRSARRRLTATDYSETNAEKWPPRARPLTVTRGQQQRQKLSLNAELSLNRTPINGEKFATELKTNLARLKNHEILDLRKRNSLGKVYATSGRKSLADKKYALEKQLQLENDIQLELIRRNWESDDNGVTPIVQEDDQNQADNNIFEIPPAPDGFRNRTAQSSDILEQQEIYNKNDSLLSLIDERSCHRVSFSEQVQMCSDVSNKLTKHKPCDITKRNFYSQHSISSPSSATGSQHLSGHVDANTVLSLHLREGAPSSVLSSAQKSSTNRKNFEPCKNEILNHPQAFTDNESNINMKVIPIVENDNEIFKKPLPPPRKSKQQKLTKNRTVVTEEISGIEAFKDVAETHLPAPKRDRKKKTIAITTQQKEHEAAEPLEGNEKNESEIFKKPLPPPQRRRKQQKLNKTRPAVIDNFEENGAITETDLPPPIKVRKKKTVDITTQQKEHETAEPIEGNKTTTLRRSKRGHMPLKNYWSFRSTDPMPLYDFAILEKRKEEAKLLRESRRNNTAASIRSDQEYVPIASSTAIGNQNLGQENERQIVDIAQQELPCSIAVPNTPIKAVDVEKLNNMFDQLKNGSIIYDNEIMPSTSSSSLPKEKLLKNLRVQLKRMKPIEEQPNVATKNLAKKKKSKTSNGPPNIPEQQTLDAVVAEPLTPRQNDADDFSWLRNISLAHSKRGTKIQNMFEELHCSNSGDLVISDLDGLEYVYYDNDPDGSVSYLRFNPQQRKRSKIAKKFHLQFVVLSGEFTFTTNKDLATVESGSLIKIAIGTRYSIKNMTDKKAILMILKEVQKSTQ